MVAEWLVFLLLIAGGAGLFFGQRRGRGIMAGTVLSVMVAISGALIWANQLHHKSKSRAQLSVPHEGRPEEFAGSDSCRACHPSQYQSWHRSFHRTMTQVASPEAVRAPFGNITLELEGETYRLEKRGDEFWVEMPDPDATLGFTTATNNVRSGPRAKQRVWRRLSMVTGSHHMQAYWVDNKHGNQQFSFPFTYLFEQERWVPRQSVFIRNPNGPAWAQIWNVGCINCHSTAGQPVSESPDLPGFDTRVAELGISCEACHGPAGQHARENSNPLRRYGEHLAGRGDPEIVNPARLSTKRSSEVCGRCHSVHASLDHSDWLKEGEPYRPGDELEKKLHVLRTSRSKEFRQSHFWSDGMIRVSGREYNGLIRSPCFVRGEMSCLSCHSMHESEPANQLAHGMESNHACAGCHEKISRDVESHTHHLASSTGSLCYNCHMPYTTYGLVKALRSHEISSPNVKSSTQTGRPNACNLCHLDKSLKWAGRKLADWYQQPSERLGEIENSTSAAILWALEGDAGQRALIAWHFGWEPARKASGDDWFAPYLALLTQDEYPAVRYIAGRSLKRLPDFAGLEYDYLNVQKLETTAATVFNQWSRLGSHRFRAGNETLLFDQRGDLQAQRVRELLKAQNKRVMELDE